ncbi:AraC family transcriptional regulator [Antrihabitans sp. YC2-6]|uniref:AraC family transcriptional regulator n=1 Tax=Antrihabitans sp. YC2-6 TaxID=2799498 RepID=UPI001A2BF758|nr:AraC family transcriptional regulator [Antrihabitans sp. YC2-6]MBJ8348817.1 AraC family transcriptional regulator [Antrihabitans sp. YC2-6]
MPTNLPRSTTSAAAMVGLASEYGVGAELVLRGTGISCADLADPAAEIAAASELALVRNVVGLLGNVPGLGLIAGARYHVGLHGIWGFALLASATTRAALELALRYFDLTFSFSRVRVVERDAELHIEIDDSHVPQQLRRFLLERDAAAAMRVQYDLVQTRIPPLRVELAVPEPAWADLYEEAIGVRPVFDAPRSLIVGSLSSLDLSLPQANPLIASTAQQQCSDLLRARRERLGTAARVREVLIAGPMRLESVAAELGLSERTLHRRLASEETSFREIVTETTVLLAQEMLAAGLTVEDVASRVGYGGAPAFVVAFKKWTGVTPGAWARAACQDLVRPPT